VSVTAPPSARTAAGYARPILSPTTRAITLGLIVLVVIASFLGRYDIPIAGFRVRIEQLVPLALAAWMIAHPSLRGSFLRTARHPVVLVFAGFIVWNLVTTLVFSPDYGWSASILIWFVIDLLLLMSMMTLAAGASLAERLGRASVLPWALVGFAAYVVANLTRGAFAWGTDFDWLYEVYVARVSAIEANIYASILIFWGLFAITRRSISWWTVAALAVLIPLGLIASQTRTAVFSMVAGLVVFALYTLLRRDAPLRARVRRVLPSAVLAATLVLSYAGVAMVPSSGTPRTESTTSSTDIAATPSPSPDYVPDPTDPDTQNKIGDVDLRGGTIGFRITVAELAAQEMTGVNLWLGNGTNTFGLRHEQPGTPGISGHIIMLPVQVLYDAGIVGLVLLGALYVLVFVRTPRSRKPLAAGLLVSYAISATLTSMFWFAVTWILVAVLLRPDDEPADDPSVR
jgi:hypothetical protein